MSTNFARGRQIVCPFCNNPGYLIKERPRKKRETHTLRGIYKKHKIEYYPSTVKSDASYSIGSPGAFYPLTNRWRNYIHSDYGKRNRTEYYRIKHNHGDHSLKPFCYLGSPIIFIKKIEKICKELKILNTNQTEYRTALEPETKKFQDLEQWLNNLTTRVLSILNKTQISYSDMLFLTMLKRLSKNSNLKQSLNKWLSKEKLGEEIARPENKNPEFLLN